MTAPRNHQAALIGLVAIAFGVLLASLARNGYEHGTLVVISKIRSPGIGHEQEPVLFWVVMAFEAAAALLLIIHGLRAMLLGDIGEDVGPRPQKQRNLFSRRRWWR